jgi:quercetin dioxygenase-like cupin family protein
MPSKISRTSRHTGKNRSGQVASSSRAITDERGTLTVILEGNANIQSVLLVTGKAGTLRANHYHKTDSHYVYLLDGEMEYTEKDMRKKNARKKSRIVRKGDLVFSPPFVAHAMRFLKDTLFLALATAARDEASYEADTVRVKLVS